MLLNIKYYHYYYIIYWQYFDNIWYFKHKIEFFAKLNNLRIKMTHLTQFLVFQKISLTSTRYKNWNKLISILIIFFICYWIFSKLKFKKQKLIWFSLITKIFYTFSYYLETYWRSGKFHIDKRSHIIHSFAIFQWTILIAL